MRTPKMLASAMLRAGLIWFLGLTVDRMLGVHSLYRVYGWPALGICFAVDSGITIGVSEDRKGAGSLSVFGCGAADDASADSGR
jgi:hypothetical protein